MYSSAYVHLTPLYKVIPKRRSTTTARGVVNVNVNTPVKQGPVRRGRSPVLTSHRDTCRHRIIDVYTGVLGVEMKTLPVKAAREPTQ